MPLPQLHAAHRLKDTTRVLFIVTAIDMTYMTMRFHIGIYANALIERPSLSAPRISRCRAHDMATKIFLHQERRRRAYDYIHASVSP